MCFSMSVGGGGYARMALRKVVMKLCVFGRVEVLSCKSNQVFGWVGVVG